MSTLFVNACLRGRESRTLGLCREYLAGTSDVEEVDLAALALVPLDGPTVAQRSDLIASATWDDPIFDLAHQLAAADEVVVGAPYWDLSFPSALKVYLERASVCGITFDYTERGECVGRCRAHELTYITTCGGTIGEADYGYDYVRGMAHMFGIPRTHLVAAELLDVVGIDVDARMDLARRQMAAIAAER
ncbi:MAG: NAD(P)H-dependent oxidoreductase [Atopobiaceae bacterium]|jgi:FMN-dependent NADH-azoreductase|nr:NAD(P)H-dependent oxidoreductase [Atopobiaceae bacterium]MCH4180257.1 NAD(P)H-dependent oxidoreductase [Atopobiaceae bacterium]MCH4214743.1 NAD(P)H-dependent oxidoreductase [Atopobiaceae bacterium]MCH4229142.1 NAD(P)H-dependent oxidoreductase [Atopobiaceae bacterium]MCH4276513.1 NAD(P)H-dependent oxidoreductase [Atopobiaceae bacterium]